MVCVALLLGAVGAADAITQSSNPELLQVQPKRAKGAPPAHNERTDKRSWAELDHLFAGQEKGRHIEKLAGELKAERSAVARLTADIAECRAKTDKRSWAELDHLFAGQEKDRHIEKLTGELKAERSAVARLTAEVADLRAKTDQFKNKVTKPERDLTAVSYDPRSAAVAQVLLARAVATTRPGGLPESMEKKLSGWEKKIGPTIRAASDAARTKQTDLLTGLKSLDGSGQTPDLLTFREAAELVKELNVFTLELYAFTNPYPGRRQR